MEEVISELRKERDSSLNSLSEQKEETSSEKQKLADMNQYVLELKADTEDLRK